MITTPSTHSTVAPASVLRGRGVASAAEARTARVLAVRVVQMLTKLDQALA
jgi:hypothetical protein